LGRSWVRRIGVTVLTAVCATAALAQETLSVLDRNRDPALDGTKRVLADLSYASMRYRSIYLLYRFELSDIALDPGLVPSRDEDLKLSIGAALPARIYWVPSRKFALSADVIPGYGFAERDGLEGQGSYTVRADAHAMLNHLYLNAYTGRSNQFGPLAAELGGIGTVRRTMSGVDAEVKYSSKTSVLVTASNLENSYPETRLQPRDVDPSAYDYDENRLRATFLHRTLPRVSLNVSAEGSNFEFPRTDYKSAERRHLAVGATYTPGRRSFRAEAGPGRLTFSNPAFEDFNGLIGRLQATVPVGRRWTLQGAARRDVQFSDYFNNGYFVADELNGDATVILTRRLSASIRPSLGHHRYDTAVGGIKRRDDYQSVLVGWTYSLTRVRGGFDVGYFQRDSNVYDENASGIRLILRLSFTGNRWFK
jgi:hypothetical protein